MSVVITRKNVRVVELNQNQVVNEGIVLGDLIREISKNASSRSSATVERAAVQQLTRPVAVERLKADLFDSLARRTERVPADLQAPLANAVDAIQGAQSVEQVAVVEQGLQNMIEHGRQQVVASAVARGVQLACAQIGFPKAELRRGTESAIVELIAADTNGRSIVSEIDTSDGDVTLRSEIVGVDDGSCNTIMDKYDRALQEHGIRSSSSHRAETGGSCQIAAARRLLTTQPVKKQKSESRQRRARPRSAATVRQRGS